MEKMKLDGYDEFVSDFSDCKCPLLSREQYETFVAPLVETSDEMEKENRAFDDKVTNLQERVSGLRIELDQARHEYAHTNAILNAKAIELELLWSIVTPEQVTERYLAGRKPTDMMKEMVDQVKKRRGVQ